MVKSGQVEEAIMVPWGLGSSGRLPNIKVVVEVEAAIGTVLAATPTKGYRRLVTKQKAGWLIITAG